MAVVRALMGVLVGLASVDALAVPPPYARVKGAIVRELQRAQPPARVGGCGAFASTRLLPGKAWRRVSDKPTPTVAPPPGVVAIRGILKVGNLTITWNEGRGPVRAWGVVELPGKGGGRAELPARGAPSPRALALVALRGTRMVVFGGIAAGGVLGDGAIFDFTTGRWTRIAHAGAPSPRAYATAAWVGDRLFVWGGGAPNARATQGGVPQGSVDFRQDGAILDVAKNRWTPVTARGAPSPRRNSVTLVRGDRVVLIGGHGQWEWPYEGGHSVPDLAIYDLVRNRWSLLPVSFWDQPFATVVAELPDGWFATYGGAKGLFLLDALAARLHEVPVPAEARGLIQPELLATCEGVTIFGGKKMTDPGGGCENFQGPGGCDPVSPTYVTITGGWSLAP